VDCSARGVVAGGDERLRAAARELRRRDCHMVPCNSAEMSRLRQPATEQDFVVFLRTSVFVGAGDMRAVLVGRRHGAVGSFRSQGCSGPAGPVIEPQGKVGTERDEPVVQGGRFGGWAVSGLWFCRGSPPAKGQARGTAQNRGLSSQGGSGEGNVTSGGG